jgi:hypothetical protein
MAAGAGQSPRHRRHGEPAIIVVTIGGTFLSSFSMITVPRF